MKHTMFDKLKAITRGLIKRFPEGNEPFRIITGLAEECGEVAKEVNHFERTGTKIAKYGEPDRKHLAKELRDVMICALRVAIYYGVEEELEEHIVNTYERMRGEGLLDPSEEV